MSKNDKSPNDKSGTKTNLLKIRPLDEYLEDLKSRNIQYGTFIPNLKKTVEGISNYDDLYKKLIEESYYMCSELVHSKGNIKDELYHGNTRNKNKEREEDSGNINKALIFHSTENLSDNNRNPYSDNTKKINRDENNNHSDLLSPIIKHVEDNKSYFYSTNNKLSHTELKHLINANQSNREYIGNQKIPQQASQIQTQRDFPSEDFLYLINNTKEIEKMLNKADTKNRIDIIESTLSSNIRKLDDLQKDELNLIEHKHELDHKIKEINNLCSLFEDRYTKLEDYLELFKANQLAFNNPNEKVYSNSENNSNVNKLSQYISENEELPYEVSGNKYTSNANNVPYEKNNINENEDRNIQYNNSLYPTLNMDLNLSHRINSLLANSQIKEADDLWKKSNYAKFEGFSFDRAYEMLVFIAKMKDKEISILKRKLQNFELKNQEMRKKDAEIVELLAELESSKNKLRILEKSNTKEKYETKINSLIKENSLLYKENVKYKTLLQQEKYFSNNANTREHLYNYKINNI